MRVNEKIVVLDESLEAFGNRSEIVRILVLAMTTAGDGASGNNFVPEARCSFCVVLERKW